MTSTNVSPPVVHLAGVDKVFATKSGADTVALRGIDLDIQAGEFISLIGPSGCGKSTLLRIVGDLTAPTSGTVTVNGKPAHQARLDRETRPPIQLSRRLRRVAARGRHVRGAQARRLRFKLHRHAGTVHEKPDNRLARGRGAARHITCGGWRRSRP